MHKDTVVQEAVVAVTVERLRRGACRRVSLVKVARVCVASEPTFKTTCVCDFSWRAGGRYRPEPRIRHMRIIARGAVAAECDPQLAGGAATGVRGGARLAARAVDRERRVSVWRQRVGAK